MPSLSWKKAVRLLGPKLSAEERGSPEWPDSLEFRKIAALQYRGDGTTAGDRKARDNQAALVDALCAAAASGEISTEMRELQRPKFKDEWVPRPPGMGSEAWASEFGVSIRKTEHVVRKVPAGFETYLVHVVSREAFRLWLDAQGEPPSEHVRAWLETTQAAPKPAARGAKRPKKMDMFLSLLEQIESQWEKSGRGKIDRSQWPGTSKELCVLAGQLMPKVFGEADTDSFYQNYPRKVGLNFSHEKGTGAVYEELFPPSSAAKRSAA